MTRCEVMYNYLAGKRGLGWAGSLALVRQTGGRAGWAAGLAGRLDGPVQLWALGRVWLLAKWGCRRGLVSSNADT